MVHNECVFSFILRPHKDSVSFGEEIKCINVGAVNKLAKVYSYSELYFKTQENNTIILF